MSLLPVAAAALSALRADAATHDGVAPVLSSPGGAWRSPAMVMDMWLRPAAYGASQGVAKPRELGGPGSVHENGLCVDINNWRDFGDLILHRGFWRSRRLDQLCAAHGFYPDARYPNEPWHYQHIGTGTAGTGVNPFEEDEVTEDDIKKIIAGVNAAQGARWYRNSASGAQMVVNVETGYVREFATPADRDTFIRYQLFRDDEYQNVSPDIYEGIKGEAAKARAALRA